MNEPIISPLIVYLITRLDKINCALHIILGVCLVSPFIIIIGSAILEENPIKGLRHYIKVIVATAIVAGFSLTFLPTTKEAMMIYAASKITPQMVQSVGDSIDKAADKIINKIMSFEKQNGGK